MANLETKTYMSPLTVSDCAYCNLYRCADYAQSPRFDRRSGAGGMDKRHHWRSDILRSYMLNAEVGHTVPRRDTGGICAPALWTMGW